ncbi:MAG: right-handed parallel beta-helix repeat-containing protein [Deltaproteobacteria bacterium]|nr:right-handed parallel beta-helix repeat-containing protein [Deltaproteobacteria bacterium]
MRKVSIFSVFFILTFLATSLLSPQPSPLVRYVNKTNTTCRGHAPCYSTIQAAIDAVQPGDTIRIQAGTYKESVLIQGKNNLPQSSEEDRIFIEAAPAAHAGKVKILGDKRHKCTSAGDAVQLSSSHFITLRGLTIKSTGSHAIRLNNGTKKNTAIHIERNRIFSTGPGTCGGGIVMGKGNAEIVLVNNLIYGTGQEGVSFSQGVGGPHYIASNTIRGNGRSGIQIGKGQEVWLLNNVITGNGTDPKSAAKNGFGVKRKAPTKKGQPEQALLLNNLICGNASGEFQGPILDGMDKDNLTPTGTEGPGVSASPDCQLANVVYTNVNGLDGLPNTADDDFTLATSSPAIDRGADLRLFDLGVTTAELEADYFTEGVRPQDGDSSGMAEFDIGAVEKLGGGGGGACTPGATRGCYDGPAGTAGVGVCHAGTQTCSANHTFGPCLGEVVPSTEVCNNQDDDCDGQVDDGLGQTTCGVGACQRTVNNCANGLSQTCTPGTPAPQEICGNNSDDDCNGIVDDPGVCNPAVPPDPSTVASPIDRSVATTLGAATQFLYTGNDPIQTGVAPGTIEPQRAAVLRGKVLDKTNTPLSGVVINILDHPEFGQTLSRADGMFDLAVNGGGPLTVRYAKTGFLPAQRQMEVPWQDYVMLSHVILVHLDAQVTAIDLTALSIQVARSSVMTDSDGARQTTLLFLPGTTATMQLPDNSTPPLSMLHVRATEYTVGSNGPNAMPGDLPPTSFYTYAVEYSVDEAVAAGAVTVSFNQPIIQYNENFMDFPVGIDIPSGAYDTVNGQWVASTTGRIIKILSLSSGMANLDLDGSGQPATDPQYATFGITVAERQTLATLYTAGQSLWRVPIIHFSSWDSNWGWGPPPNAGPPSGPPPQCDT